MMSQPPTPQICPLGGDRRPAKSDRFFALSIDLQFFYCDFRSARAGQVAG